MKILPVIVIYNSFISTSGSATYNYLLKEFERGKIDTIFIFDNSTEPKYWEQNKMTKFTYSTCHENKGLSYAYNAAAEFAKIHDYDWLLLLDQDTILPSNLLTAYTEAVRNNEDIVLFAPKVVTTSGQPLSPAEMTHYIPKRNFSLPQGIIDPSRYCIINSGLLINVEAFFKVGGYNENVKVDFADFQFIEKFSRLFNRAFVVNAECLQSFSDEDHSDDKKIERFKIFCSSLKNFEPVRRINKFWISVVVAKRALSLSFSTKKLTPFKILFNNYFL